MSVDWLVYEYPDLIGRTLQIVGVTTTLILFAWLFSSILPRQIGTLKRIPLRTSFFIGTLITCFLAGLVVEGLIPEEDVPDTYLILGPIIIAALTTLFFSFGFWLAAKILGTHH